MSPPDRDGRAAILRVHMRGVPLADDVDLGGSPPSTPGMVGADLRNLVNEAALIAARRDHDRVHRADFTDALEKIVLGAERRIMLSPEERERTAYHESGHALLGMLQPGADPVRKISIVPRGRALGVTFQAPDADRYGYGADYLRGRIIGALGGRAAEELVYGDVTTGAESDLEQVTRIARQMVGRWGMSEVIGPVSVLPGPDDEPLLFPGIGRRADVAAHAGAGRRGGAPDRRRAATPRPCGCCARTASGSTRWPRPCSSARRSTRPTPTRSPASRASAPRAADRAGLPARASGRALAQARGPPRRTRPPPRSRPCPAPGRRACPRRGIRSKCQW